MNTGGAEPPHIFDWGGGGGASYAYAFWATRKNTVQITWGIQRC